MDFALLLRQFSGAHRETGWSGQRMLHEALRDAIQRGVLSPGLRLPGSRVLASELAVARNTVLYAYEQLATEGLITSDRRGSRVNPTLLRAQFAPVAASAAHGLSRRAELTLSGPRQPEAALAFAAGVPALEEFPLAQWRRLLERRWRSLKPEQLNYAAAAGAEALREAIASHLSATRGVRCVAAQVFITDGTQDSLALCAQALCDVGDKAWLESPGYNGALSAWRAAGLRVIGIAVDEQGMAPQPGDWQRQRPRLIYTTPSHQYPSGAVMSLERRLALLRAAQAVGAWIIEDDYDSEFRHDGPPLPAMQGLLPEAPVLYLGTFSKTLFPALRIGFIVAPLALTEPLQRLLAKAHPRGRAAEQLALADFLRDGQFGLHLRRMRRLYRQRRDALVAAVERHFDATVSVHGASAGMHLALRFQEPSWDDAAISQAALAEGLIVHALSELAVGRRAQAWRGLMLGYAQVDAARMDELVARLAALCRRGTASRPAGA